MTDDNRPYCHVWKQHLTRYSTPYWSASHAHRLIYMIKALFNTSARSLMSRSPENTSAPRAEVWVLYKSIQSRASVPLCGNNDDPLSRLCPKNNGSQLPVNNKLEF